METAFSMFCDIISGVDTHYKRAKRPWIAHLSFCLKPLIYMYLFKTDHALVNPLWGHFVPRALFEANLNMVHPLDDIRDLDLVVSNQESLYVSIYKSM